MKHIFVALGILLLTGVLFAQTPEVSIVPRPQSAKPGTGTFKFSRKTKIVAADDVSRKLAGILNGLLKQNYGFELPVTAKQQPKNKIELIAAVPADQAQVGSGYRLDVTPDAVTIAGTENGLFYGVQSLMQLLPVKLDKTADIPAVEIRDQPRFQYRGMHLDVSRHFWTVDFVKKYIDLMAQYKFNNFHWHLTDDQGWRIEIKKYPKLTEIGSKRPESVLGRNLQPYVGDKTPVEGFYTQDQIRDVVAYARARYINVIPEIEIPGHSSAALAAYPEFGCKQDYQYKVQTTWGIFKEVYCPTEKTFQFLEDVIGETIDLFPDSPYIHIGGDEVLKDMWKESPEVKELMQRENLKDVNEVQSYFVRRMEKFINSKGKKIIGWDEILEGGLAPNATVMSWRGMKGGIEAAKAHHDVIMTPTDYAYLDYGQGDPAYEPLNIGNYLPLEKVYSFDPVPKELSPEEAKYIIGGQGNLWVEYIADTQKVEYMVFPRMLALAEDVWTNPENKDYADFMRRLPGQLARLDKQNVSYRIPEPLGLRNLVLTGSEDAVVTLTPPIDGAKIYYTTDGTAPNEASARYDKPIEIDVPQGGRVDLKTIVVLPTGRQSSIYAATILRRDYLPAVEIPAEKRPGLTFGFTAPAADPAAMPVMISGETRGIGFQPFAKAADLKQPFSVTYDGFVNIPTDGIYEFQTDSTWDASITVDGEKVVESIGTKDRAVRSGVVPLRSGWHRISIRYNHRGGESSLRIRFGLKGQGLRGLGGNDLAH